MLCFVYTFIVENRDPADVDRVNERLGLPSATSTEVGTEDRAERRAKIKALQAGAPDQ